MVVPFRGPSAKGGRIRLLFLLLLPFCHALPTQVTVDPTAADLFGDTIVPESPQKSDPPLPQDGSSSTLRRATQNSGGSAQILREETTLMEETTKSDSQAGQNDDLPPIEGTDNSPTAGTCDDLTNMDTIFGGVIIFIREVSELKTFSCKGVWYQDEATQTVWVRGTTDGETHAVHVLLTPDNVEVLGFTPQGSDSQGVADEVPDVGNVFQVGDEQHPGLQLGDELLEVKEGVGMQGVRLLDKFMLHAVLPIDDVHVPPEVAAGQTAELLQGKQYGLGHIEESEEVLALVPLAPWPVDAALLEVSSKSQPSDESYDFETEFPGALANQIVSQGTCGSCWAFASAKAYSQSLYKASNGVFNVALSEQQMTSCMVNFDSRALASPVNGMYGVTSWTNPVQANGCDGGSAIRGWFPMKTESRVSRTCDPYTGTDHGTGDTCGSHASATNNNNFCEANTGTADLPYQIDHMYRLYPLTEDRIKTALLLYGPLYMAFSVYPNFYTTNHAGGAIYSAYEGAQGGGHAVTIVGWGVENGVKYWKCANSWGPTWGNNGYFKYSIAASIETSQGGNGAALLSSVFAVQPKVPDYCGASQTSSAYQTTRAADASSNCQHGTYQADCKCRCDGAWGGANCDTCSVVCQNGGVQSASSCTCTCAEGYFGSDCSNYMLVQWQAADGPAKSGTVQFQWNLAALHPTVNTQSNKIYERETPTVSAWCPASGEGACGVTGPFTTQQGSATKQISFEAGTFSRRRAATTPAGQHCFTTYTSLGVNEFGVSNGNEAIALPCVRLAIGYVPGDVIDGSSGKCLCGGHNLAAGSSMSSLACSNQATECGSATAQPSPPPSPAPTPIPTVAPTMITQNLVTQTIQITGVSDCAGIEGDIENTVRTNAQIAGLHDVVATITITNCSAADSATTLTQTSAQRPTSLNFLFQMKSAASVSELVQEGVKATSSSAVAYSAVVSSSNAPTVGQLHFLATRMDSQNTSNTLCSSVNGCTDVTVLAATKVSAVSNQDSLFPGVDSSTNSIIMFAVIGFIVLMLGLIAFITCWCTGACCFAKPGQHEEEEWGTHAKYVGVPESDKTKPTESSHSNVDETNPTESNHSNMDDTLRKEQWLPPVVVAPTTLLYSSKSGSTATPDSLAGAGDTVMAIATVGVPMELTVDHSSALGTDLLFSVAAGVLPAGLYLDSKTGTLSGTPQLASDSIGCHLTILAANSAGSVSAAMQLTIGHPKPQLPTINPPVNVIYTQENLLFSVGVSCKHAAPILTPAVPATYTIEPALHDGLTQNRRTGAISGTAHRLSLDLLDKQHTVKHTVTATNEAGSCVSHITITIVLPPPEGLEYSVANTFVGVPMESTAVISPPASRGNVLFSVADGTLPEGLSLHSKTGTISGTPTQQSDVDGVSMTIKASNSGGGASASFSFVTSAAPALSYPDSATLSDEFPLPEFSLMMTEEMSPARCVVSPPQEVYKFSLDMNQTGLEDGMWFTGGNGALPKGLVLNESTGEISGTPVETGFAKVTIQATQRNGHLWASSSFLFVVDEAKEQL